MKRTSDVWGRRAPAVPAAVTAFYSCPGRECDVSLTQLLSRPDVFDGLRVRTSGWVRVEFESMGLFAYRADLDNHSHGATWLELLPLDYARLRGLGPQFVEVSGVFTSRGHLQDYLPSEIRVVKIRQVPERH